MRKKNIIVFNCCVTNKFNSIAILLTYLDFFCRIYTNVYVYVYMYLIKVIRRSIPSYCKGLIKISCWTLPILELCIFIRVIYCNGFFGIELDTDLYWKKMFIREVISPHERQTDKQRFEVLFYFHRKMYDYTNMTSSLESELLMNTHK